MLDAWFDKTPAENTALHFHSGTSRDHNMMDGLLLISALWHSRPLLFDIYLDFMLGKVTATKYKATGKSSDDTINHRLMSNSHPTIVYLHGEALFTANWSNCGPLFCFHSSNPMSSEATKREALSLMTRPNDKLPLSHPISIKQKKKREAVRFKTRGCFSPRLNIFLLCHKNGISQCCPAQMGDSSSWVMLWADTKQLHQTLNSQL